MLAAPDQHPQRLRAERDHYEPGGASAAAPTLMHVIWVAALSGASTGTSSDCSASAATTCSSTSSKARSPLLATILRSRLTLPSLPERGPWRGDPSGLVATPDGQLRGRTRAAAATMRARRTSSRSRSRRARSLLPDASLFAGRRRRPARPELRLASRLGCTVSGSSPSDRPPTFRKSERDVDGERRGARASTLSPARRRRLRRSSAAGSRRPTSGRSRRWRPPRPRRRGAPGRRRPWPRAARACSARGGARVARDAVVGDLAADAAVPARRAARAVRPRDRRHQRRPVSSSAARRSASALPRRLSRRRLDHADHNGGRRRRQAAHLASVGRELPIAAAAPMPP